MIESGPARPRITVDGKFFRRGTGKFYPKGVTYGPFAPHAAGEPFASPEQTARDFALARQLGANLLRLYDVPPRWLLEQAAAHELRLLIDIPWNTHLCFLDSKAQRDLMREAVRRAVYATARHPAVFAYSVANEIPPDIARWGGAGKVADFLDELVLEAKGVDPDCLCTFTNYPPTEFLRPQTTDFVCFNVYLHQPQSFKNYLARLQMLADAKPLVLGEFGIDSLREGEAAKCEMLRWQIELAFCGGLAGAVVFSFTDDWFKDRRQVADWQMGLTTVGRKPKESFTVVQRMFRGAPHFPLPRTPKVSVVVASYNGDRTLKACLESLGKLNYPEYEIILVDDGSTDTTAQLAAQFTVNGKAGRNPPTPSPRSSVAKDSELENGNLLSPALSSPKGREGEEISPSHGASANGRSFRYIRHKKNLGLSVARNTGIAAAEGEIVAFTDSDCRADEDWLYYLVGDLLDSEFAGLGGPNLLPPEDSAAAAAVMLSPGGPAHVMLDDHQAEHIPGCNMAFFKSVLTGIGGFDPIFAKAGDDVDICWRLQQAGFKIGFSPAAFVWHYRRANVGAYLKQQRGYGEAEALLVRKHPEYFNSFGGSIWRGRIYTASKFGVLLRAPIIYRGVFGSAMFQSLYASQPAVTPMLLTALEYHVLVTLPLWVLAVTFRPLLPLAITSVLISLAVCAAAGAQSSVPKGKRRWWSRPLVALLYLLQPIVRGWARYSGRVRLRPLDKSSRENLDSVTLRDGPHQLGEVCYWAERPVARVEFVARIIEELDRRGWPNRSDIGWSEFDVEIFGNRWSTLQLTTVSEDHPGDRQMLRCRLRARWSLQAKAVFWSLLALDALVIGFFGSWLNWLGLLLLMLPAFAFFVHRQKRNLQSLVIVSLDELAKEWRLSKVPDAAHGTPRVEIGLVESRDAPEKAKA